MDEKKMTKTGSQRVKDWRLRHLREHFRTEVLLSREDAATLDGLCAQTGLDRSAVIRELIRTARWHPDNGEGRRDALGSRAGEKSPP